MNRTLSHLREFWPLPRHLKILLGIHACLIFALWLTSTRGGLGYFCPQTLEYETQSEITVFFGGQPIYRSAREAAELEMLTFIKNENYVLPDYTSSRRWELLYHWNRSWRDGEGFLYRVLFSNRKEIIAWSKANPECARIYWSEGFRLLRSQRKWEQYAGQRILENCWMSPSPNNEELMECIDRIKADAQKIHP